MPKRDLYALLGVSTGAAPGEIRRAYRRIAFGVHPDVGDHPDPERFREAHEAYEVLSDPERRRSYDIELSTPCRPVTAEPLRSKPPPLTVLHDFLTVRPSTEELLDYIGQDFFGHRPKSGGLYRRLRAEAVLDPEEARFGCEVPFKVPCYVDCRACSGTGQWWGLCRECCGTGMVEGERQAVLRISRDSRDGDTHEVDLSGIGIGNVLLEVRIVVL
jgi:molecular chaperone DnaJ